MKTKKGFSLIELMVVMSIIAVLSAIGILAINLAKNQATNTKRVAAMKEIETALAAYAAKNGGEYPELVTSIMNTNTQYDCSDVAYTGSANGCALATKTYGLQKLLVDGGYLSTKVKDLDLKQIMINSTTSHYAIVACNHKTTYVNGGGLGSGGILPSPAPLVCGDGSVYAISAK